MMMVNRRTRGVRRSLYAPACTALLLILLLTSCRTAGLPLERIPLLDVGVATIDITPEEEIRLSGYGGRSEPTNEAAQRLHAKALAFGGDRPTVLVTADLVGVSHVITDAVARRLADRAGVAREDFVIAVTHTHSGPQLRDVLPNLFSEAIPADEKETIDRYTDRLVDLLEQVSLDALADRTPARLSWGKGEVGFAVNRRVLEDGRWKGFGVNPEGPVDHDLPVLRVDSPDGTLRAVLLSYACHCTTVGPAFNKLHGDWAGMARDEIESRHPGATALVTIGCGGDQNPEPRGEFEMIASHANAIADEVDRLLRQPMREISNRPIGRLKQISLSFDDVPTTAEWQAMAEQDGPAAYHAEVVLQRRGPEPTSVRYPVQTWTFGDELAMVFLGGEVVVDYSRRLKRELDEDRLWIHAYSNDVMCYIASDRVLREGGYEADLSMHYYDKPGRLALGTEDHIVGTVHELLPDSYESGR